MVSQPYFVSQNRGIRLSCIEQDRHWMVNAYIHIMGQVGAYYRTKGQLLEERQEYLPGATLSASWGYLPGSLAYRCAYLNFEHSNTFHTSANILSHARSTTMCIAPLKKGHPLDQGCIHASSTYVTAKYWKTSWPDTSTQAPHGMATTTPVAGLAMTFSAIDDPETSNLIAILQSSWHARSDL